jgi:hypothetical protein
MARKPNYSAERNAKAKAKAEKREAKRLAKLAARAESDSSAAAHDPEDAATPPDPASDN